MKKLQERVVDGFELSDDDSFKPTVSYLQKRYKEFNERYFGGILPNIPIKVTRLSSALGTTRYTFYKDTKTVQFQCITISNYYDRTEKVICGTLLHEMIHVYQQVTNPRLNRSWAEAHDESFTSKMDEINEKGGWGIGTKELPEDSLERKKSNETLDRFKKNNSMIVFKSSGGYTVMLFCSKKTLHNLTRDLDTLKRVYNVYNINDSTEMAYTYQVSRSLRGYKVTDDFIKDWEDKGYIEKA